jgi:TonB family protein
MSQQFSPAQRSDASVFPAPSYAWRAPEKALTVRLPFDLIDRLEREAVENFRSIDALGSEIGGLLFGGVEPNAAAKIWIEDFEVIPCDYSRGPFYRLSDTDLARVDAAIERRGGAGAARVAGFFRSHSRKGLALDAEDMQVIEARFRDPWQIALLVRPFATKVSTAGIFIWEDGRMRGEASYLEFPFRSSELAADSAADLDATAGDADAPLQSLRPLTRAAVVPMPSRLKLARPSPPPTVSSWAEPVAVASGPPAAPLPPAADPPAMPAAKIEEPSPVVLSEASKPADLPDSPKLAAPEPKAAEPLSQPEPVETEEPAAPAARASRGKLLWLAVAAALVACSGALFLYPGLFRHNVRPPAALTLRIERTATDLLLTWNRDSDAVRNAKKAVLSISDGDRQENLELNLSDLRNGSIVYSPLSSDVSFRMEVTGPDQLKTASESVRVLRTKPSPMGPEDGSAATPAKQESAPRAASENAPAADAAAADAAATDEAAVEETPAARRAPTGTFSVPSLAQRLRPALPTDLPEAPVLGATADSSGQVNLGALSPATISAVPRPSAPPEAKTAPEAKTTPEPARDIRQPVLVSRVNPVYPDLARQQRISGTVSLSVTIGVNGRISSVKALAGPELLRRPAMDAVKQWVYSPMTMNGRPVETEKQIDLNFSLGR